RLQEELKLIALKKCDDQVRAFVECSKANGILVVLSCRRESAGMNECLHTYTNPERFAEYKTIREAELLEQSS
ncbi:unnamed protein product, partial [Phaeothamnion confervicola]